jgi:hypothetical protein
VLFLKAILRYWWALMSCAAFTFLGIWVTFANKGRDWVLWSSLVLGVGVLLFAAYKAWATEHQRWTEERRRYDEKFKGVPRLQVREIISGLSRERIDSSPEVYFLDDPSSYPPCTEVLTLSIAFENNPVACTAESVAKGVSATITFYDGATGTLECSVGGRWEKTRAQGGRMVLSSETLIDEIPINARIVLIAAIKAEGEDICYGTSVDAFHDGAYVFGKTGQASPWVINAKDIDATIRVRGISVDQCWLLRFTNEGNGKPFTSTTVEEVEPSFRYSPAAVHVGHRSTKESGA